VVTRSSVAWLAGLILKCEVQQEALSGLEIIHLCLRCAQ
jgi:hypothetical protein